MSSQEKMAVDAPRRTIFIDCTHTWSSRRNTGVQRAVRNIANNAVDAGAACGWNVRIVVMESGRYVDVGNVGLTGEFINRADLADRETVRNRPKKLMREWQRLESQISAQWRTVERAMRVRTNVPRLLDADAITDARAGDILLLAEDPGSEALVWDRIDGFIDRGGILASIVYDLIPVTAPEVCQPKSRRAVAHWLETVARKAQIFVAISQTVKSEFRQYVTQRGGGRNSAIHEYFYLGSGLDLTRTERGLSAAVLAAKSASTHRFLAVGSIDPRKRQGLILDAFERHWQGGGDAALIVVGNPAGMGDALLSRFAAHPELDRRLFVLRNTADADLDHLYRTSTALIFATIAEGFGLPMVEAAVRGLPAICSDIPVLREISRADTRFFPVDDVEALTAHIEDVCRQPEMPRLKSQWPDWQDSTRMLIEALDRASRALQKAP